MEIYKYKKFKINNENITSKFHKEREDVFQDLENKNLCSIVPITELFRQMDYFNNDFFNDIWYVDENHLVCSYGCFMIEEKTTMFKLYKMYPYPVLPVAYLRVQIAPDPMIRFNKEYFIVNKVTDHRGKTGYMSVSENPNEPYPNKWYLEPNTHEFKNKLVFKDTEEYKSFKRFYLDLYENLIVKLDKKTLYYKNATNTI